MNLRKSALSTFFVAALVVPTVLGVVPLTVPTPAGEINFAASEAEARARNTANNRLRDIRVPTAGANLRQNFRPTRMTYNIALHQDTSRVALEPRRDTGQNVRHRIDTRRANGTWNNGSWSSWRTGSNANNRINIDVNRGQERRVRIAVRDSAGNIRTYTVRVGRASSNTWGSSLTANAGSFNRSFNRSTTSYTLNIPFERESVRVTMGSERNRATIRTRVNNGTRIGSWSGASFASRGRTVSVPPGESRVVEFRIRGAFSGRAPSPTHQRIYSVTVNRSATPSVGNADGLLTVMDQSGPPLPSNPHRFVRYRGTLELTVVDGRLRLVNELPMQEYLFGVVPREIPTSAGVRTAVEAQAIAARSFALDHTNNTTGVSSTVSFQVYGGHSRFASEANWRSGNTVTNLENTVSNTAVTSTGNRVILHNGNVVRAFYSACNGDRTANSEDVWVARLGHTRSVADPFCGRSNHVGHSWTASMTGAQVASALRSRGETRIPANAHVTRLVPSTNNGWVRTLTVHWSNASGSNTGNFQIGNADNVRIRLGLRSARFTIATPGTRNLPSSTFNFSGTGWGHGVGMSQNGAMQQAREGRSANQILQHYFTNITIANRTPSGNMRVNLDASRNTRTSWTIGPANGTANATMIINGRHFNGANGPYTFRVVNGNIRMTPRTGATVDFGRSIRITAMPVSARAATLDIDPMAMSLETTGLPEGFDLMSFDDTLSVLTEGEFSPLYIQQEMRNAPGKFCEDEEVSCSSGH